MITSLHNGHANNKKYGVHYELRHVDFKKIFAIYITLDRSPVENTLGN